MDFWEILEKTQEYISGHYAGVLSNDVDNLQLKAYIKKFIRDSGYQAENNDIDGLVERINCEMTEYSVITPYLGSDEVEEININGWDDVAVTYRSGKIEKLKRHFRSPEHATDIVKRLLHHSGMIIDNATPLSMGHLPGNARITALKTPIVDPDRGVAVSIRILHPYEVKKDRLISGGFAACEMIDFLCACVRYGVPFVIAGATSSGKTTLLNAILDTIPENKRIFTIESGARELSLLKRSERDAAVVNNVVHTLSRPSESPAGDITQEQLVVASLRFNPDVICVGEMRDVECYAAVEASLTGHTVVSTVHSGPAGLTHTRIALLCQKRFPIKFEISLIQAAQAFPVVVYTHKLENNERKIMDISECIVNGDGERQYNCLYSYIIDCSFKVDGKAVIQGHFVKQNPPSEELKNRLIRNGLPTEELKKFEV